MYSKRFDFLLIAAVWGIWTTPAGAANDPASAGLQVLRDEDLRAATVFRRLAMANLPLCRDEAPISGLLIHNAIQYADTFRPTAIALFDVGSGISVEAVVPGSAAERAGIRAGDQLHAVNGEALPLAPISGKASHAQIEQAQQILDRAFSAGTAIVTGTRDGQSISARITSEMACKSALQVIPDGKKDSGADGHTISITSAMIEFLRSDDELAIVIAHELAHNVLGHREQLDAANRPVALMRATEVEADRYALYFAVRAGFDPRVAPDLWRRLGRAVGADIVAPASHPSPRARAAAAFATIDEINAKRREREPLTP